MEKVRKCLECNEPLRGRIDQKFCSDYCRNAYNNKQRRENKEIIRDIDKKLHKNRNILAKLCTYEKTATVKLALKAEGYNFNYLTNFFRTKNNAVYYFCYDYGFRYLDDTDKILIVKKQDYI
ncbi:MAG: hypothetical protein GXO79_05550 [Chlorobi bacterium]|nr:hypothetical protein [Chlorobiota bacterium]